jgi:hypothetical protein
MSLSLDDAGRLVALWHDGPASLGWNVRARVFQAGSWGQRVDFGRADTSAVVSTGPSNAAAWVLGSNVVVTRRTAESWSAPIAADATGYQAYELLDPPQIGVDEAGNVLMVWVAVDPSGILGSTKLKAYASRLQADGRLRDTRELEIGEARVLRPIVALALDRSVRLRVKRDRALAVVSSSAGTFAVTFSWREGWGKAVSIPGALASDLDRQANAAVLWREETQDGLIRIGWIEHLVGVGWTSPRALADQPYEPTGAPSSPSARLAMSDSGTALLTWRSTLATSSLIRSRWLELGRGWSEETTLGSTARSVSPAVAVGPGGDALVVWESQGEGLVARRYLVRAQSWMRPERLDDGTGRTIDGWTAAIDSGGNAAVLWQENLYGTTLSVFALPLEMLRASWFMPRR